MRAYAARHLDVPENVEVQFIDETHDLSQQIFFRRDQLGWTQEELAEKAGVTQAQIARLEAGHENPTLKTITKLAHAFGCRVAEITTPGIEDVVFDSALGLDAWWRWNEDVYTGISHSVVDEGQLELTTTDTGWIQHSLGGYFTVMSEDDLAFDAAVTTDSGVTESEEVPEDNRVMAA